MPYSTLSQDLFKVSVIDKHILLVTLTRPQKLNAIPRNYHVNFNKLWTTFEQDPEMYAAVLTGSGRLFSAGADLVEWASDQQNQTYSVPDSELLEFGGFMGISNRSTKKPIIAALNGSSFGGGTEVLLNCDLAVCLKSATIALPEVKRGLIAVAGALPRAARHVGLKRANQLALTGDPISADTALQWGLINAVEDTPEKVLNKALQIARSIVANSPDAVQASLKSIRRGLEDTKLSLEEASYLGSELDFKAVKEHDNIVEGLASFIEKRSPVWKPPKL